MTADLGELERLVEQLRIVRSSGVRKGNPWNPDGPAAADMIEALGRRLRAAEGMLEKIAESAPMTGKFPNTYRGGFGAASSFYAALARSALPHPVGEGT